MGDYAVDLAPPTTLDDLFKTEVEEDEAPEVDETAEPVSKLGEVYQLGRHRLMCGDSTKIEDVEKLMNGQKADMVFTDPPYGVERTVVLVVLVVLVNLSQEEPTMIIGIKRELVQMLLIIFYR